MYKLCEYEGEIWKMTKIGGGVVRVGRKNRNKEETKQESSKQEGEGGKVREERKTERRRGEGGSMIDKGKEGRIVPCNIPQTSMRA